MFRRWTSLHLLLAGALGLVVSFPVSAKGVPYTTGFARWRSVSGGFASWKPSGLLLAKNGTLLLNRSSATRDTDPYGVGGYNGHNFYNGGSFLVGEALSPVTSTNFGFAEAIVSWNADTPTGTWTETQMRVQIGTRWSKWYNLGVWAADSSTVERHSVNGQGDTDATVAVDTLVVRSKTLPRAFQVKARLFSANSAVPTLRNLSVAYSTAPSKPSTLKGGDASLWNRTLAVPQCSQMVYPDGGEVWCSPTSTSMVLAYWQQATGPCEPRVRAAVDGVYDWLYDGHGNWPFNTAYAASQNLEGYVARFTSFAQAERWIAAGVPVIFSFGWQKGDLTGAAISSSGGHLAVLVGFDAAGNPVVNDPAAASDGEVLRTYQRAELESLWLEHSGGTVYLIYPPGHSVPNL